MKKLILISIISLCFLNNIPAQQTVGVFLNEPNSFNGYTLFSPNYYNHTYLIDGTGFKGEFEKNFLISSYWNHEILKQTTQISGISCKIKDQKVSFLRKEIIEVNKVKTATQVFDIQGTDLNTQVWFREKDFTIVRQVLHQKGTWRYEVQSIN